MSDDFHLHANFCFRSRELPEVAPIIRRVRYQCLVLLKNDNGVQEQKWSTAHGNRSLIRGKPHSSTLKNALLPYFYFLPCFHRTTRGTALGNFYTSQSRSTDLKTLHNVDPRNRHFVLVRRRLISSRLLSLGMVVRCPKLPRTHTSHLLSQISTSTRNVHILHTQKWRN